MRTLLLAAALLPLAVYAQDVTGRWTVEGVPFAPWTLDLVQDGNTVRGTVNQGPLDRATGATYNVTPPVPIFDGVRLQDGVHEGTATIAFKAHSPDRAGREIAFEGEVRGDEIAFTRVVQVPSGADPGRNGIFGAMGPAAFTARRESESSRQARELLGKVGETVARAPGMHLEGSLTVQIDGSGLHNSVEGTVKVWRKGPNLSREEIKAGPAAGMQVCDGKSRWTYISALSVVQQYAIDQRSKTTRTDCVSSYEPGRLAAAMLSPEMAGRDSVTVAGASVECQLVRGEMAITNNIAAMLPAGQGASLPGASGAKELATTLCIDAAQRVLRIQFETGAPPNLTAKVAISFTGVDYGAEIADDLFTFTPPPGAKVVELPSPAARPR